MTEPGNHFWALSGSRREGFRFQDSDIDLMFWEEIPRVVWDYSQCQFYDTNKYKLIFSDSSESLPGFTLILLTLDRVNSHVASTCVNINGAFCISSSRYRDKTCEFQTFRPHGPCTSGRIGSTDIDHAHCLVSDFWPPIACSWINRCNLWPAPHVVDQIVKSGCHVVAIGHKLSKHVENEWRISFSKAETKLVYSMNHTQFLTYGLLKLFLKEILNIGLDEDEKLLCSYHVKTAILWAIQQNAILDWCPQNLLECFWVCFKLLLKWIYEGVCPNFFIPENNMFLYKIFGNAQNNLFARLLSYYEMGVTFLLQSPSISSYVIKVLCQPWLSVGTNEQILVSEEELQVFEEVRKENWLYDVIFDHRLRHMHDCMKCFQVIQQLIYLPVKQCQIIQLKKLTARVFQTSAFMLHNRFHGTLNCNRHVYSADRISCYMLKQAVNIGFTSSILYLVMYYYKTLRCSEALSIIDLSRVKFRQIFYPCSCVFHQKMYEENVRGRSLNFKTKQLSDISDISINNRIRYVDELTREQNCSLENSVDALYIPAFVLLNMLDILCSRPSDLNRAQRALDDLEVLIHYDEMEHIP